jgi:hypothetical protein
MEERKILKISTGPERMEKKIKQGSANERDGVRKDGFAFNYSIAVYFLLIIIWFALSLVIAYAIVRFAEYMTNLGIGRFSEPYITSDSQFLYEMIAAILIVFMVGVFSWYTIMGRYKKNK